MLFLDVMELSEMDIAEEDTPDVVQDEGKSMVWYRASKPY